MEKIIQIITTSNDRDLVERMGRDLVEKRLVACAQISGPVQSIYQWKGVVEEAQEWFLFMKSKNSLYPAIEAKIREWHSYELPEIVVTDIEKGFPGYLEWVINETK